MLNPQIHVNRDMALGDVIQITPIIRELYSKYQGNCNIHVTTRYPDVFKNSPYVTTVNNLTSAPDVSINLDLAYEKFPRLHIAEAYKKFVFGDAAIIDKSVELFSTEEDKTVVQQFFIDNSIAGPVVVVHMRQVGIVDGRNIPIDFWGDLLELVLDSTEATVIQIGSNNDLSFDGDPRLVNALGKFSIHQLKELIAQADVFVGADSAPMHVAFCTATPVVGLFTTVRAEYREVFRTPSNFESVASNIECYGCKEHIPAPAVEFTCGRNDVDCVNRFDPKIVLDKIEKFL